MSSSTVAPTKAPKLRKTSELKPRGFGAWVAFIAVLLVAIGWLFPFWMAVANALKTQEEFIANGPLSFPTQPTLEHLIKFWNDVNFPQKLWNSTWTSLGAAVLTVTLSFLTAYAIGIGKVKGKVWILGFFMVALTLPQEAMIYPMYIAAKSMSLYDNLWVIVIIFGVLQTAFGTYLLSSVLTEFPSEILEAAKIDGANAWRMLTDVVLPILRPTLLVLLTMVFIWNWNEFLIPLVLLPSNDNQTVSLGIAVTTGQWTTEPTARAAAALLGALPSLIFFLVFQRSLMRGVTMGAVK
jgi:raffinose/stachyose/melibiose transport system permease protein